MDLSGVVQGPAPRHIREYRISELARYMLLPRPVEVKKRLVGCEIHPARSVTLTMRDRLRRLFRRSGEEKDRDAEGSPTVILSHRDPRQPEVADSRLADHLAGIDKQLRSYDPTVKRLLQLETSGISEIVGICEDMGGNRSLLNLQGSMDEKAAYLADQIDRQVGVLIDQSHIADGLFDMSGFDFSAFNPKAAYRLHKFLQGGATRCVVMDDRGFIDFQVEDTRLLGYMQLLQHSIKSDPKLNDPLLMCIEGEASPLKLFFNTRLEIDYSKVHFPALYRKVMEGHPLQPTGREALLRALGDMQLGVAFNYVPRTRTGEEKRFTSLSVMHDLKALEPIRNVLPRVYSEINKRVLVSDMGRFYLLDSIKGYKDDIGLHSK